MRRVLAASRPNEIFIPVVSLRKSKLNYTGLRHLPVILKGSETMSFLENKC
jgi:hypothetical protein